VDTVVRTREIISASISLIPLRLPTMPSLIITPVLLMPTPMLGPSGTSSIMSILLLARNYDLTGPQSLLVLAILNSYVFWQWSEMFFLNTERLSAHRRRFSARLRGLHVVKTMGNVWPRDEHSRNDLKLLHNRLTHGLEKTDMRHQITDFILEA